MQSERKIKLSATETKDRNVLGAEENSEKVPEGVKGKVAWLMPLGHLCYAN